MPDINTILNGLTLALVVLGAYGLKLLKTATDTAVKKSAEEAAKAAIQELQWPAELGRDLQKTRGIERQELRFKSYGGLWKELRPLAIYETSTISKETIGSLNALLSDCYFSECGGLLLTPQAREFYFALQDLLRVISKIPQEWHIDRSNTGEGNQSGIFMKVLTARSTDPAVKVLDYFQTGNFKEWRDKAPDLGKKWREGIQVVAASWQELDEIQRFATLQQVGSILRTSLCNDLESRLH